MRLGVWVVPRATRGWRQVRGDTAEELGGYWNRLAGGATEALASAGWSPLYGMLGDWFGVTWLFDVAPAQWQGAAPSIA